MPHEQEELIDDNVVHGILDELEGEIRDEEPTPPESPGALRPLQRVFRIRELSVLVAAALLFILLSLALSLIHI